MTSEAHPSTWAPWGLALLLLALGLWVWEPFPPGVWHDDGVYVLLGRALADGEGLRYVGVAGEPLAPKFPPLYPFLLAVGWLFAPDFPANVPVLGALNPVLMAVAAGRFAVWLRRWADLSTPLALAVTALAWLGPALWRVALIPLSEPLFLLSLVASAIAAQAMEEDPTPVRVALFMAAAAAAFYTRTLGIAVLAAGILALLLLRRPRHALWASAGALAVAAPWALWSGHAVESLPPVLRDTLGPYGGWWLRQALEDPTGFIAFVSGNAVHLVGRILSLLLPGVVGPPLWAGLLLLPFLAVGMAEIGRRTATVALMLVLSLGILLLWPFQDIRLLVPFHPYLVLATVLGFRRTLSGRRRGVVAALLVAWLALDLSVSVHRFATGWIGQPYRVRSEALAEAARAVVEHVPTDAVVGAPELWAGLHLLTGRTVVPSAPFHALAGAAPAWGTPAEQHALWMETGVTHLLLEHGGRVHGEALNRLAAVCGADAARILDRRPGRFLVALQWDEACRERLRREGPPAA